jgi:hypothetical protein
MEKSKNIVLKSAESMNQTVERSAEETYAEIANSYGNYFDNNPKEIFWQNACQQFSEIMKRRLEEKGRGSNYLKVNIRSIVPNGKPHIILLSGDYLIDGTWQQFLDKPRADHHCLILNINSLEHDLEKASVPRKLWFVYGAHLIARAKAA